MHLKSIHKKLDCEKNVLYNKCYYIKEIIDKGADGIIYNGIYDKKKCVIKKMKYDYNIDISPVIIRELIILNNISHNNLINAIDVFSNINNGEINIIMKNKGETLLNFLLNNELTDDDKNLIILQLLNAINGLHENNYIHGDISLKNILVKKEGAKLKVTLIDFSTTTKHNRYYKSKMLPTSYICPYELLNTEFLTNTKNPKSSDIFSLGCIIYFVITKKPLFEGLDEKSQYMDISNKLLYNKSQLFFEIKEHYMYKIIRTMIQLNPTKRPDIRTIINDNMVKNKMKIYGLINFANEIDKEIDKELNKIKPANIDSHSLSMKMNKNRYNIDINLKVILAETILNYKENIISYETIFLTLNNLSKLKKHDYVTGIILFWLSVNIIENMIIPAQNIREMIIQRYPKFNLSNEELIKKKYKLIQKLNYDIDESTIYQIIFALGINERKKIIRDSLILMIFTDRTYLSNYDIYELLQSHLNNNIKENLNKKYDVIKKNIYMGNLQKLNDYNEKKYNYKDLNIFNLFNKIDKIFK